MTGSSVAKLRLLFLVIFKKKKSRMKLEEDLRKLKMGY